MLRCFCPNQSSYMSRSFPDVLSKYAEQHQVSVHNRSANACSSCLALCIFDRNKNLLKAESGGHADAELNRGEWKRWQPEVKFSSAARSGEGGGGLGGLGGLLCLAIATAVTHCAAIDLTPTSGGWLKSRSSWFLCLDAGFRPHVQHSAERRNRAGKWSTVYPRRTLGKNLPQIHTGLCLLCRFLRPS